MLQLTYHVVLELNLFIEVTDLNLATKDNQVRKLGLTKNAGPEFDGHEIDGLSDQT